MLCIFWFGSICINIIKHYFVKVDVDLHEPTQKILDLVHKSLSKNGLIISDELNKDDFQGEKHELNDFFNKHNKNYKKKF